MKRTIILAVAAALAVTGCAKQQGTEKNEAQKKYFDSWIRINHPDAKATPLGTYILSETKGSGPALGTPENTPYVRANYTARTLDGKVVTSTEVGVNQQVGTYSETAFYGPEFWVRTNNNLYVGVEEVIAGMNVGGKATIAVPGWLCSFKRYSKVEDYMKNVSGKDLIYEFEIVDGITDVKKWETDSLVRFLKAEYPQVNPADTTGDGRKYGFYYICNKPSDDPSKEYKKGDKVYFNYTGRLLNGQVFDTTVEKVAKDAGIYSSSRKYGPTYMTWAETYDELKFGSNGSETIDGFRFAFFKMRPHEKGTAIFHSSLGYQANGSGTSIPPYSPLIFEFEIVDKE